MKKLIIAIGILIAVGNVKAQVDCSNLMFPSIDSLQRYVNIHIRNSAINAFTNLRLNTAVIGTTQWLECLKARGVDSFDVVDAAGADPDTLKAYRNGAFAFYKLLPAGGGGGGTPGGSNTQVQFNDASAFGGDTRLLFNKTTNTLTTDTVISLKSILDSARFQTKFYALGFDSIQAFGHSIMVGTDASPIGDSSFIERTGDYYGKPVANRGYSGGGITTDIQRLHQYLYPGHRNSTWVMSIFNDARRGGNDVKTHRKLMNAFNSMFIYHYAASVDIGLGSNVTRSGTWSAGYGMNTDGGRSTVGAYSTTTNDSATWVFNGTAFGVSMIGVDGTGGSYTGSNFRVRVDGVIVYTGTQNNQTDGLGDPNTDAKRSPMGLVFTGLSDGPHTVTVINDGGGWFFLDYFAKLLDPVDGNLLVWYHAPKMNATGYAISPANANDGIINAYNASLDSLAAIYQGLGYPIRVVETNNSYVIASGLSADNIHPNNTGHRQIFNETSTEVGSPAIPQSGTLFYAGGRLYISDGISIKVVPTGDVIYKNGQFSADTLRIGVTNNKQVGIYANNKVVATFQDGPGVIANGYNLELPGSMRATGPIAAEAATIQLRLNIVPIGGVPYQAGTFPSAGAGVLYNTESGIANENYWKQFTRNNLLLWRTVNDANNAEAEFMRVKRTGIVVDSIYLSSTILKFNGAPRILNLAKYEGVQTYSSDRDIPDVGKVNLLIAESLGDFDSTFTSTTTTANATPVTIATIYLDDLEGAKVIVDIIGIKDDGSAIVTGRKTRSFHTNGTITALTLITDHAVEYSAAGLSTATFTITTSGNTGIIQVTGEAGENINWKIKYDVFRNKVSL